jgi:hypothetical protein
MKRKIKLMSSSRTPHKLFLRWVQSCPKSKSFIPNTSKAAHIKTLDRKEKEKEKANLTES